MTAAITGSTNATYIPPVHVSAPTAKIAATDSDGDNDGSTAAAAPVSAHVNSSGTVGTIINTTA